MKIESSDVIECEYLFRTPDEDKFDVIPAVKQGAKELDFPALVRRDLLQKRIVLFNPTEASAPVRAIALDRTGAEIGHAALQPLAPMQTIEVNPGDLFDRAIVRKIAIVRVECEAEIIGQQVVDLPDRDYYSLPALSEVSRSWVLQTPGAFNGIVLWHEVSVLNRGEAMANVKLEAIDKEGASLALIDGKRISPRRVVSFKTSNTGGPIPDGTAYLKVLSNQPISAFELTGVVDGSGLTAFPGVPADDKIRVRYEGNEKGLAAVKDPRSSAEQSFSAIQAVAVPVSDGFDYPIGSTGNATQANDGDGWYNAQDFTVSNHLGEDWNGESGGNTDCGLPVYASSKGSIIYAADAGNSWGKVLIIRHQLPDGTLVETLYGHLQSFTRTSGDVGRREQVGTIGRDRVGGACHLHFELRFSNCPSWGSPGPGYSTNTTGWTDPSNYVDAHRSLQPYEGYHDGVDCDKIFGWAWNRTQPNTAVNVDIYDGSVLIAANVAANQYRADLPGNRYHAFNYPTLASLKDGRTHSISVKISGTNVYLVNTPKSFTSTCGVTTAPAQMTSPPPGSTLSGSSVTFNWNSGAGATQYWLYVGNSQGGSDIYNVNQGTNRSATVTGIPTDGRTIYVRLWSYINGAWQFNDYTYRAASASSASNRLSNPSFESGAVSWIQYSSGGYQVITNSASTSPRSGSWLAWMGGSDNLTEYIYQDVFIPANATQANVQFFYKIATNEGATTTCYDRLAVEVRRPSDNALLATLKTLCNNSQTGVWTSSGTLSVLSFRGQTVRLRFIVTTDGSLPSSFYIDDVTLVADGN